MSAARATTAPARAGAVCLPVVEQGDADGVPVVLLHGLSDSWRSFEPVLPHLPPSLRVLAVTQRGHGDAPKPVDGYGVEQLAADVVGVLDDAGVERAIVAGHSMGSIVATRLALDAPERVAGLVLMGAKPTYDDPALDELYAVVEALEDPVDPVFVREFQESTLARPVTPGLLDTLVEESLKLPARVWHALTGPTLRADHSADLGRISVPTLVAWGDRDDIATRADQEGGPGGRDSRRAPDRIPRRRTRLPLGGPGRFRPRPRRFRRRARRRHREERLTMPAIHVNGIDLYHEVEGDGPPLVVVHGSWADHMRSSSRRSPAAEYRLACAGRGAGGRGTGRGTPVVGR